MFSPQTASSTSDAPETPFRFLDLPPELRRMVYQLLSSDGECRLYFRQKYGPDGRSVPNELECEQNSALGDDSEETGEALCSRKSLVDLSYTCKDVREESLDMVYVNCRLIISPGLGVSTVCPPLWFKGSNVTCLELDFVSLDHMEIFCGVSERLDWFPNLRSFDRHFYSIDEDPPMEEQRKDCILDYWSAISSPWIQPESPFRGGPYAISHAGCLIADSYSFDPIIAECKELETARQQDIAAGGAKAKQIRKRLALKYGYEQQKAD